MVHMALSVSTQVIPGSAETSASILCHHANPAYPVRHPGTGVSQNGLAHVSTIVVLAIRTIAQRANTRTQAVQATTINPITRVTDKLASFEIIGLDVPVLTNASSKAFDDHVHAVIVTGTIRHSLGTNILDVVPLCLTYANPGRVISHGLACTVLATIDPFAWSHDLGTVRSFVRGNSRIPRIAHALRDARNLSALSMTTARHFRRAQPCGDPPSAAAYRTGKQQYEDDSQRVSRHRLLLAHVRY